MRGQPVDMRAGRAAGQPPGGSGAASAATVVADAWQPLPRAEPPASVRSWQGLVRLGLLSIAAGSEPVDPTAAPETLAFDLGRLRDAQTAFQQLIVLAACSLLLHRTAAGRGRALSSGNRCDSDMVTRVLSLRFNNSEHLRRDASNCGWFKFSRSSL